MISVFYSWQSDLPTKTNRYFIQDSLKKAVKEINKEVSIELEVRFDQDTKGITGSPDISHVIFDKITNSDIFVGDISIVCNNSKRCFPNPNVLIEYGYALRHLSWENVIGVFNKAFGRIEDLPFDLNHRRPLTYYRTEEKREENSLAKELQSAIQAIIRRSENLKITSQVKVIQSLVNELEENFHIVKDLKILHQPLFEDNKYIQIKDDLRSLIPEELYENIREIYSLIKAANLSINRLTGIEIQDFGTVGRIEHLNTQIRSKIEEIIFKLRSKIP